MTQDSLQLFGDVCPYQPHLALGRALYGVLLHPCCLTDYIVHQLACRVVAADAEGLVDRANSCNMCTGVKYVIERVFVRWGVSIYTFKLVVTFMPHIIGECSLTVEAVCSVLY